MSVTVVGVRPHVNGPRRDGLGRRGLPNPPVVRMMGEHLTHTHPPFPATAAIVPRIFDNLTRRTKLLPALKETLALSSRADFCVGYINLRGWGGVGPLIDRWTSEEGPCRVLVGMQRVPEDELREHFASRAQERLGIDNRTASRLRRRLAMQLRDQLTFGAPTNEDEVALRRLARQLRAGKVKVKLFLRHSLHAKLYLLYRDDPVNPVTAFLGSSNLTFAGMAGQGELNVDVLDQDAARKLQRWFEDRWRDRFCVDITDELIQIIEESWAREDLVPPYHVYLKMAYHLSQEARVGLDEFSIPPIFTDKLFDFQAAAVRIAARHVTKRGGVLIGDVVGLGKTRMATAVAKIFDDDLGYQTLIICPKNLVSMWEDHVHEYRLRAKVVSLSKVLTALPDMRRYRLVLIDESHNLRNREGKRYKAIHEYITENESRVILLTATPYNKTYHDLSNQLRLFIPEDEDIGIRPERALRADQRVQRAPSGGPADPGRLREERIRRRLARSDAPLPGQANADVHSESLYRNGSRNGSPMSDHGRRHPGGSSPSASRRPSRSRSTTPTPATSTPGSIAGTWWIP